jgi:hypothetical protein
MSARRLYIIVGAVLAPCVVMAALVFLSGGVEPFFERKLDAMPVRVALMVAVFVAFGFGITKRFRNKGRGQIGALVLLCLSSSLSGVFGLTAFQLLSGVGICCLVLFLAFGRFEPKPSPEAQP